MSISTTRPRVAFATDVRFDEHMMHVFLLDGRQISVPLDWFPLCGSPPTSSGSAGD